MRNLRTYCWSHRRWMKWNEFQKDVGATPLLFLGGIIFLLRCRSYAPKTVWKLKVCKVESLSSKRGFAIRSNVNQWICNPSLLITSSLTDIPHERIRAAAGGIICIQFHCFAFQANAAWDVLCPQVADLRLWKFCLSGKTQMTGSTEAHEARICNPKQC